MDILVDDLVQIWDDGGDGVLALDGITHHFRSGKLTCLLGPSGCGKSTLVQIVGGIETATSGNIRIIDPSHPDEPSARPGERSVMMWQNLNYFPGATSSTMSHLVPKWPAYRARSDMSARRT